MSARPPSPALPADHWIRKLQKNDWKEVHREQWEKLQQVFVSPPAG